jgi:hypothetical protein
MITKTTGFPVVFKVKRVDDSPTGYPSTLSGRCLVQWLFYSFSLRFSPVKLIVAKTTLNKPTTK